MSKKNRRRQQGAKRLEKRREALLIARESAALRDWKRRNDFVHELSSIVEGR